MELWLARLFLLAVAFAVAVEAALAWRQIRHLRRLPNADPRAVAYGAARAGFGAVATLWEAALALAWTLGGGLALLDRVLRATGPEGIILGLSVMGAFAALSGVAHLPLAWYRTFRLEQRFGFNRTTPRLFAADALRIALLALMVGAPAGAAALWIMEIAPRTWWLWVWALWMGLNLLLAWAFPVLIAPLFFRHRPLEDPALRQSTAALVRRCGLAAREVLVADGSRRSAHGNAYFAGLGSARRVILFDTLVERLGQEEILAVVAHELGHDRLGHIRRRLRLAGAVSLAAMALAGALAAQPWFYAGLGLPTPSAHGALLLAMVAGPWFAAPLTPFLNAVTRRHEREADAFAAALVGRPAVRRALIQLYRDSAVAPEPDPLYSAWHESHPPPAERLARLGATLPRHGACTPPAETAHDG